MLFRFSAWNSSSRRYRYLFIYLFIYVTRTFIDSILINNCLKLYYNKVRILFFVLKNAIKLRYNNAIKIIKCSKMVNF